MNDGNSAPPVRRVPATPYNRPPLTGGQPTNLADLLERVLDKGIVIAGDVTLALASVDILTLKIRLLIASVDKAQEIGINWWQSDPTLSSRAKELQEENELLRDRLERLEARLGIESDGDSEERERAPKRPAHRARTARKAKPS